MEKYKKRTIKLSAIGFNSLVEVTKTEYTFVSGIPHPACCVDCKTALNACETSTIRKFFKKVSKKYNRGVVFHPIKLTRI